MSKNKNKSAVNTKVETEVKNEVKTEQQETVSQVDNKEADKAAEPEVKEEVKVTPKPKAKKEKKEEIEEVTAEEIHEVEGQKLPTNKNGFIRSTGHISTDTKVQLANLMHDRYTVHADLLKNRTPEFVSAMSEQVDLLVLMSCLDIRQDAIDRSEAGDPVLRIANIDDFMNLQKAAATLGIKIEGAKALPAPDGQLELNLKTDMQVPKNIEEGIKKDKEAEKAAEDIGIPETDCSNILKFPEEEQIKMVNDALNFLMREGAKTNLVQGIMNTTEWYRKYCMEKETNANKKVELDNRLVGDWLVDVFNIIQPTTLLKGLASGGYTYTSQDGNIIMFHAMVHKYAKDFWNEDQIASVVKALLQSKFQLEKRATPGLEIKSRAIEAIYNTDNKLIDNIMKKEDDMSKRLFGVVRSNYFSKDVQVNQDNIRYVIGHILNRYRDPASRLIEFEGSLKNIDSAATPKEDEKKN